MTRSLYPYGATTWGFYCDNDACDTVVGPRDSQADLPLTEFREAGWFVAKRFGDRCPECVAAGLIPDAEEWGGE